MSHLGQPCRTPTENYKQYQRPGVTLLYVDQVHLDALYELY